MSKRNTELLLLDMIEAINKIHTYISGITKEQFLSDEKTIDAVVRNLEILGEAANRLPEDFKLRHSNVEWIKIIGLRHRIVHDYFGIDLEIIWSILEKNLHDFEKLLIKISEK